MRYIVFLLSQLLELYRFLLAMSRPHPLFFFTILLTIAAAALFSDVQFNLQWLTSVDKTAIRTSTELLSSAASFFPFITSISSSLNTGKISAQTGTEERTVLSTGQQRRGKHEAERNRLLDRLKKDGNGKWDAHHPRHRLLTALHGFYRYESRNLAELGRWRDLYKNVPKRQRSVSKSIV